MLRIHFTSQDLQRIRVAQQPDALWELVCSVCRLQTREGELVFDEWRQSTAAGLRRGGAVRDATAALRDLVPVANYFPDFLTPPATGTELAFGIDRVLATPRRRIAAELVLLAQHHRLPAWAPALAEAGAGEELAALGRALHLYHDAFLAPYWDRVRTAVAADVAWRARVLVAGGTQELLNSLRPLARWQPPVLEVRYPVDRDLLLDGRGLLLQPSYFCWGRPVSLADGSLEPVLVYPVDKAVTASTAAGAEELAGLVGQTRAAVLAEAAELESRTTSELADAVGVSVPTASQQLTILREAGLVVSRRDGKHVLHTATPLGLRLLGAGARAGH